MRCDGCTRPVHYVDDGIEFCKGCDFSTAWLYEKPKGTLANPRQPRDETPDHQYRYLAMRSTCMRTLGLKMVLFDFHYRLITDPRDYAASFLKYADEHGIVIPNREQYERMRDGK